MGRWRGRLIMISYDRYYDGRFGCRGAARVSQVRGISGGGLGV